MLDPMVLFFVKGIIAGLGRQREISTKFQGLEKGTSNVVSCHLEKKCISDRNSPKEPLKKNTLYGISVIGGKKAIWLHASDFPDFQYIQTSNIFHSDISILFSAILLKLPSG